MSAEKEPEEKTEHSATGGSLTTPAPPAVLKKKNSGRLITPRGSSRTDFSFLDSGSEASPAPPISLPSPQSRQQSQQMASAAGDQSEFWEKVYNDADSTKDDLLPFIRNFAMRVKDLEAENESLKTRISEMEAESKASEEAEEGIQEKMLKKLLGEEETFNQQIQQLESDKVDLELDVSKLETELTSAYKTIDELRSKIEESGIEDDDAKHVGFDDDSKGDDTTTTTAQVSSEQIPQQQQKSSSSSAATEGISLSKDDFDAWHEKEKAYKHTIESLERANADLEKENKVLALKARNEEETRRKSVASLHNDMFRKLMEAEEKATDEAQEYQEEIKKLKRELAEATRDARSLEDQSRKSISDLHGSMLAQILDAEEEQEKLVAGYEKQLKDLRDQLRMAELRSDVLTDESKNAKKQALDETKQVIIEEGESREDLTATIEKLIQERNTLLKENEKLNQSLRKADVERRDSVTSIHDSMFRKMLEAEHQYQKDINEKDENIEQLKLQVSQLEKKAASSSSSSVSYAGRAGDGSSQQSGGQQNDDDEELSPLPPAPEDKLPLAQEPVWHSRESVGGMKAEMKKLKKELGRRDDQLKELEQRVEETEIRRRESVSFMDTQMMTSLLDAQAEHEFDLKKWEAEKKGLLEEKKRLENKVKELQLMNDTLESTRRASVTSVSATMFTRVLQAEKEKTEMKEELEGRIDELEEAVTDLQNQLRRAEETDLARRQTVSDLQTSHMRTLVEAEEEDRRKQEEWNEKVQELQKKLDAEVRTRRKSVVAMEQTLSDKLGKAADIETELEEQIEELRDSNSRLDEQVTALKLQVNQLEESLRESALAKAQAMVVLSNEIDSLRKALYVYTRITG